MDAGLAGAGIVEQTLAVETWDGLAVVTGCAHPGVLEMVRRAQDVAGGEVTLVVGGSHLGDARQAQIEHIIADLRSLGVQRAALSHCTGERAQEMCAAAFGADFKDYHEIIHNLSKEGWRLVQVFAPATTGIGMATYFELIFEKPRE